MAHVALTAVRAQARLPRKECQLIPLTVPEIRHVIERILLFNPPEEPNVLNWPAGIEGIITQHKSATIVQEGTILQEIEVQV